jgi:alkylation response protein AidB-like acyl-CoA dehydrogenase
VNLTLTAQQDELRGHMRALFERTSSWEVVRAAEPLGYDADVWRDVAGVGLAGMCLDESVGGGGSALLEAALVIEEAGRCAAPVPLAEHIVASRLAARAEVVSTSELEALAVGALRATVALWPAVNGTWRWVPGGAVADVVFGEADGGLIAHRGTPPMAGPRNHACAPLADRSAVGTWMEDDWRLAIARDEWRVLTAALLVGVASRSLDLGVAYAKERVQFGRPIGSFQALQHGLADLVAPLDGARLLTAEAAWACDHQPDERPRLAAMAYLAATEISRRSTAVALHYHGGYGVMQEYDIQLLFRRARGWSLVLGDPDGELQRLGDHLFGAAV